MNEILQNEISVIETASLRLRKFKMEDAWEYFKYHTSPDALKYYDWKPDTLYDAEEDVKCIINDYQEKKRIQWAITFKDNDTIIGDLGLITEGVKGEVNYMVSHAHCQKGVMREALNALISFCFQRTELKRIQALCMPENDPSSKLLSRLGFKKEGLLRLYGYNMITNENNDLIMWSILKSEFGNFTDYKIV